MSERNHMNCRNHVFPFGQHWGRFVVTLLLSAAGLGCAIVRGYAESVTRSNQPRPNIVFLLTDDQHWDTLGCMGNPVIHTPNIDRLAREGVLFRNAFVTTSVCGPSRASILTGTYARARGVGDLSSIVTPGDPRGGSTATAVSPKVHGF